MEYIQFHKAIYYKKIFACNEKNEHKIRPFSSVVLPSQIDNNKVMWNVCMMAVIAVQNVGWKLCFL